MSNAHVLVVEDETIVSMDIQSKLKDLGCSIAAAVSSGHEAVQSAAETSPDLVLMDINLHGDMDGVDAAGRIQRHFDIPIIYLTAYADDQTLQRAIIADSFGYVVKPFTEQALHAAIEVALHRHRIEGLLKKSERRFVTALRGVADAIVATDSIGFTTFLNPPAAALARAEDSDGVVRSINEFLGEGDVAEPTHQSTRPIVELAEPISGRELEVLRLIATGMSNREIADELVVTVGTVKKHLNNMFGKLSVRSRTQAAARARELHLL